MAIGVQLAAKLVMTAVVLSGSCFICVVNSKPVLAAPVYEHSAQDCSDAASPAAGPSSARQSLAARPWAVACGMHAGAPSLASDALRLAAAGSATAQGALPPAGPDSPPRPVYARQDTRGGPGAPQTDNLTGTVVKLE